TRNPPTNACSATRSAATPACSRRTSPWKRPGTWSIRCWTTMPRWSPTRRAAGALPPRPPSSKARKAGPTPSRNRARHARRRTGPGTGPLAPIHIDTTGIDMTPLQSLRDLGQSLWLDNITRELLDDGTLQRYIDEYAITGLTSNPTIFDQAIGDSSAYDAGIREKAAAGKRDAALFVELALEDLRRAADLFRPVFDATDGVDGWVSMELSPLLAADTAGSIEAARRIHAQGGRDNLYVKIPGTPEGIPAIEESIFAGVPINVTLLFSTDQYLAAANAYLRGIERRIEAGLDPKVGSVASLFI